MLGYLSISTPWLGWLQRLLIGVLVSLVAYQLAMLTQLLLNQPTPLPLDIPSVQSANTPKHALANQRWFTQQPNSLATPPLQQNARPLPPFQLLGTMAFNQPNQGVAILRHQQNNQQAVFSVGENLADQVQLQLVYADRVVISNHGIQQQLLLEDQPTSNSDPSPAPPTNAGKTYNVSAMAQRIRNTREPLKMLQAIVRPIPLVQNGQLVGYRLTPGRDRRAFRRLGLERGDIVTAINGVQLHDPRQGIQLMQQLMQANRVSLLIQRDGQQLPLTLLLNQP